MNTNYDVIIIGAGILGCACAYYLTQNTEQKVLLVDRQLPANGTTSQAAGLIGRAKSDGSILDLVDETWQAIHTLQQLGETIDLHHCGSLHIGQNGPSKLKIQTCVTEAEKRKRQVELLSQTEAADWLPWLKTQHNDLIAFFPEDGYVDPYQLALAFYRQAKKQGLLTNFSADINKLLKDGNAIKGIETSDGSQFYADNVVLTGGPWTALLTQSLDFFPAMAPIRSQYWMTDHHPQIPSDCPILILPDANAYLRPEIGGLLFGLRDRQRVHASPKSLPNDIHSFQFSQDNDGLQSLEDGYSPLQKQLPLFDQLNLANYMSGVSSYTPDGRFLIGETAEFNGLWLATGCCGGGVGSSAGFGRLISELIAGVPTFTAPTPFDPNRFAKDNIDPFNEQFRLSCALAREGKTSG